MHVPSRKSRALYQNTYMSVSWDICLQIEVGVRRQFARMHSMLYRTRMSRTSMC